MRRVYRKQLLDRCGCKLELDLTLGCYIVGREDQGGLPDRDHYSGTPLILTNDRIGGRGCFLRRTADVGGDQQRQLILDFPDRTAVYVNT